MPPQENSTGPVIATIIILAVIVLGGLYFWSQRSSSTSAYPASTSVTPGTSTTTQTSTTNTYDVNATLNGS